MTKPRCQCPYYCKVNTRHEQGQCVQTASQFNRQECKSCGSVRIQEICASCRSEYERWATNLAEVSCFNPECFSRLSNKEEAWVVYGDTS